ncbi:MAG: hypothetical protein IV105_02930 [Rhizobacter sp.]|nr:hypothetical protein [Rhizobacter sp.]
MRQWLKNLLTRQKAANAVSDLQHAINLIAAIDAGGIPLNPARVNAIGRALGLEVSRHARMEDTIARIREVVGARASEAARRGVIND